MRQQMLAAMILGAYAHMEIRTPFPRRSRFNPNVPEPMKDYDMVAPLLADGSNFPCKRYAPAEVVATYQAGETIRIQASGSVFHEGGHCEFSISYNDRDFVAIRTFMKNCFVGTGTSFEVTIPATAPACDRCTLAWSWVNAVGNREFYMNCIDIRINNPSGSTSLVGKQMNVHNLPGYIYIPEFPPSRDDGSQLYDNAPTITISPTTSVTRTSSSSTRTSSSTSSTSSSTRTSSSTSSTTSSTRTSSSSRSTSSSSRTSSSSTRTSSSSSRQPTGSPRPCRSNDSRCVDGGRWQLCSNGRWYDMRCPRGTKCVERNGRAVCDF